LKNLCNGTQCGGFQFLLILHLWGISFHGVVVFGFGKDLLFKLVLGHCDMHQVKITTFSPYHVIAKPTIIWYLGAPQRSQDSDFQTHFSVLKLSGITLIFFHIRTSAFITDFFCNF
jgi:hypothetical protein